MEENKSTIERMWEADERRRNGPSVAGYRSGPNPVTEEQRLRNAARELPDEVVDHKPHIQDLQAIASTDQSRQDYLSKMSERRRLADLVSEIAEQLEKAKADLQFMALDDASAGDDHFPRYLRQVDLITRLSHRLDAARLALSVFESKLVDVVRQRVFDRADASRNALLTARIDAKVQVLISQAEGSGTGDTSS